MILLCKEERGIAQLCNAGFCNSYAIKVAMIWRPNSLLIKVLTTSYPGKPSLLVVVVDRKGIDSVEQRMLSFESINIGQYNWHWSLIVRGFLMCVICVMMPQSSRKS
jgi:hypothetical protein